MATFAEAYADQTERDHAALLAAIKTGRIDGRERRLSDPSARAAIGGSPTSRPPTRRPPDQVTGSAGGRVAGGLRGLRHRRRRSRRRRRRS